MQWGRALGRTFNGLSTEWMLTRRQVTSKCSMLALHKITTALSQLLLFMISDRCQHSVALRWLQCFGVSGVASMLLTYLPSGLMTLSLLRQFVFDCVASIRSWRKPRQSWKGEYELMEQQLGTLVQSTRAESCCCRSSNYCVVN